MLAEGPAFCSPSFLIPGRALITGGGFALSAATELCFSAVSAQQFTTLPTKHGQPSDRA